MGGKAGKHGLQAKREHALKRASTKADWLRPMLESEKGWDFATGARKPETKAEINLKRRAVTRVTKKAVCLMFPEGELSVRYDTGTARHWVDVRITMTKEHRSGKGMSPVEAEQNIKDTLIALGIAYSTYLPDSLPGEDRRVPCLSVTVHGNT